MNFIIVDVVLLAIVVSAFVFSDEEQYVDNERSYHDKPEPYNKKGRY